MKRLPAPGDRIVGAIGFCSAACRPGPRDQHVGWDESARLAMLPRLVSNNRFLILPWVKVRGLASHVLSESLKRLRVDWKRWCGVEPYMVETLLTRSGCKKKIAEVLNGAASHEGEQR